MTREAAAQASREGFGGIDLDPAEAQRKHRLRDRHFNVVQVPLLRAFGFSLLALVVFVHNQIVLGSFSRHGFLRFVLICAAYSGLSWLALYSFYGKTGRLDLGQAFLALDIAFFLLAIHHSGGERSLLFILLTLRVADQVYTTFRRVLAYAHLTVLGYVLLLLYLNLVEGRSISWPAAGVQILMLYTANLYVAFTAKTSEGLRRRTTAAIRVARELIGELRDKQAQLEGARTKAEEASRLKSEFIANMSHEIRTPLNAIIGMAHISLDGDLAPDVREHVRTIRSSANALLRIVDDVLDFARIEEGSLEFERMPFSVRDCLAETMSVLLPQARERGLALHWEVDPGLPDEVIGDPGRLRQALLHLATNAVKFTPEGTVEVRVGPESGDDGDVVAHFFVKDTGMGVPPEKRDLIFEAFTQADGSLTRRHAGLGLGLTLATRLVARMGGRLWVDSEMGVGSTFHFTARFGRVVPEPVVLARNPAVLEGKGVLVIAEHEASRGKLAGMLFRGRMKVAETGVGGPAVTALEHAHAAGRAFALVVLDGDGEYLDAFAMARRIAGDSQLGSPVILMLASGQRGDAARCREAGVAGYLRKPFTDGELLALAAALLEGSGAGRTSLMTRYSLRGTRRGLRVLLADDSPADVTGATRLLEKEGHTVVVVRSGREALAALQTERFDLVLMDAQMPDMTALEATSMLREEEGRQGGRTPVVAVTAPALSGDRQRYLDAGMDGCVVRPLEAAALFEAIEAALGGRGSAAPAPEALDRQAALARLGGDAGLLKEVAQAFLEDFPRLVGLLRQAVDLRDAAALKAAAHAIKGTVAVFSADSALEAAARLERLGGDGHLVGLEAGVQNLEAELARLQAAVAAIAEGAPP